MFIFTILYNIIAKGSKWYNNNRLGTEAELILLPSNQLLSLEKTTKVQETKYAGFVHTYIHTYLRLVWVWPDDHK